MNLSVLLNLWKTSRIPESAVREWVTGTFVSVGARVAADNCWFFLCDIQETFRDKIVGMDTLLPTAAFLCRAADALSIPVVVTEQKPFKATVRELTPLLGRARVFSKTQFSMLTSEVVAELDAQPERRHVVLFGIEAHVCVLQTALDLLQYGYSVYLVLDAVASQNSVDRDTALHRLTGEAAASSRGVAGGAIKFTSSESIVFEIMRDAQHPQFKKLLPAFKDLAAVKRRGQEASLAPARSML